MLKKLITLLILAVISACGIYAQNNIEISQEKIIENGQKYYLHTVQQGQTLYSICKAYSISEKVVLNENPTLQTGTLSIGQTIRIPIENEISKDGKYIVYLVKKGETLYSLLKRFETSEKEFYDANPKLNRSESLKVGDEIYFPMKEKKEDNIAKEETTAKPSETTEAQIPERDDSKYIYHKVEKGETLYRITKQYNISLDELVKENPTLADRPLSIDEIIRIPKKEGTTASTAENESNNNTPSNNAETSSEQENEDIASDNDTKTENTAVRPTSLSSECNQEAWYSYGKEFTVTLLLSFETSANLADLSNQEKRKNEQRIRAATKKSVDFYAGCLVALEEFKNKDIKININVHDIGKDNAVLTKLAEQNAFENVDMIIGPAFKSQVDYLNSLNLNIPMLLPFVTDESIVKSNPNNVMLNPSKQDVRNAIVNYAHGLEGCNALIVRNTSDESKSVSTKYAEEMQNNGISSSILDFNGSSIEGIGPKLKKGVENLIIVTFENEMSTNRILTQVFKLCEDYKIILIADPKIMNYESIDPYYYAEVRYTYFSAENTDYNNSDVKSFIAKYRGTFLCEPSSDAYLGADAISHFIPMLQKAGKQFTPCINQDEIQNGLGGDKKYHRYTNYAQNSYSNSIVYLRTMQKDYSFKEVYPEMEDTDDNKKK